MATKRRIVWLAVALEAALGAVGWGLAWWLGAPISSRVELTPQVALRSVVALVPLLGLLAAAMGSQWGPLVRLRQLVRGLVRGFFGNARWWELLAAAIAAGVGEELLFRGALQPLAVRWFGAAAGMIAASVMFGALHAASTTYFVLATLMGLYLGWLAQAYDDLVAPMFIHAAYDWTALLALRDTSGPSDGDSHESPEVVQ